MATERSEFRRDIQALERRRDFLGQRIASQASTYDKGEYNALNRAIPLMEGAYQALPPSNEPGRRTVLKLARGAKA